MTYHYFRCTICTHILYIYLKIFSHTSQYFQHVNQILIERLSSEELIEFFKRRDIIALHLEKEDYNIICQIRMSGTGTSFLTASKEDLYKTPLAWGLVLEVFNLKTRIITGIYFYYNVKFYKLIINLLFSNREGK